MKNVLTLKLLFIIIIDEYSKLFKENINKTIVFKLKCLMKKYLCVQFINYILLYKN